MLIAKVQHQRVRRESMGERPSGGEEREVPAPGVAKAAWMEPPITNATEVVARMATLTEHARLVGELATNEQAPRFRGPQREKYDLESSRYQHAAVKDPDALRELRRLTNA
jgi:hypothetical protein